MTLSWAEFTAQRRGFTTQYFPCPGARQTVMVCSHIWWTDQMALAVRNLGCNVLLHYPLYLLYTDAEAFAGFDELWGQLLGEIREVKVGLILGGNSAAMLAHPRTGELLHEVAGVPLVNWWWDELRAKPPLGSWPRAVQGTDARGFSPTEYLRFLGGEKTLNAIWDIDVKEELEAEFGLRNLMHLPLATLPEYWPHGYVPLEQRPLAACFLGNCHFTAEWAETLQEPLVLWARDIALAKIAAPDKPMFQCAREITIARGMTPAGAEVGTLAQSDLADADDWVNFARPWELVNAAYMHYTRNTLVQAAEAHLKGKLALIGKGWDKLGLRANADHAGDKSGVIYGQSQVCLNLFGGCVHGGMPLRPYDIGASGGLIVTHYQRELPALFEDGKECLSFRGKEHMIEQIDRVRGSPAEFNAVALAGRKRVLAEHTWQHRLSSLLREAEARWGVTTL